jgi:hypothetical protein
MLACDWPSSRFDVLLSNRCLRLFVSEQEAQKRRISTQSDRADSSAIGRYVELVGAQCSYYESSRIRIFKRGGNMLADLRDALRQLRKAPGFSATAVITLALGIGATTAIFSLVHQVMLKSLPVAKPEELWRIGDKTRCCNWGGFIQGDDSNFTLFS